MQNKLITKRIPGSTFLFTRWDAAQFMNCSIKPIRSSYLLRIFTSYLLELPIYLVEFLFSNSMTLKEFKYNLKIE